MKVHPILFSAAMVRAILDGHKSQTRRIVKAPTDLGRDAHGKSCGTMMYDLERAFADHGFPTDERGELLRQVKWNGADPVLYRNHYLHVPFAHPHDGWDRNGEDALVRLYPRWSAGDRLWVKETWQSAAAMNQCHKADDYVVYRASDPDWGEFEGWKWRPSIYMRKEDSRIELEVAAVRVERLQQITEADARAEGIPLTTTDCRASWGGHRTAKAAYVQLWNAINGKKHPWETNPWVWVIAFEKRSLNKIAE